MSYPSIVPITPKNFLKCGALTACMLALPCFLPAVAAAGDTPPPPAAVGVSLFNGKDLTGWEPIGDAKNSHWGVKDGLLVNEQHGANLKTTRKFEDF